MFLFKLGKLGHEFGQAFIPRAHLWAKKGAVGALCSLAHICRQTTEKLPLPPQFGKPIGHFRPAGGAESTLVIGLPADWTL